MTLTTRHLLDLRIDDHILTLPLVWGDDSDPRTIDVHAAVVTRRGGEDLPYLLFLQGGPGNEAPRPFRSPTNPSWLDAALAEYRVVMLDQRGTGLSTPVSDAVLTSGIDVAEYLTHLRADAIVRDAEAFREHLGAEKWNTLGQSFGGFTTLAYLTTDASSLDDVYITGGLSAVGRHPDDVYALCYDKMRIMTERYYRRFPGHRDRVRSLVQRAAAGEIVLPTGEVVSPSRMRSVGSLLGSDTGWQTLWALLELDPMSNAFRYDLAGALPFSARNPLYYVFHESSYADGFATEWSAQRTEPEDYREDVTLLTGEHVRREWAETVPGFRPWKSVVDELATFAWPSLYDEAAIRASHATGAAAIYANDVYVPLEFSLETAALLPGVHAYVTSDHEHSGLRSGTDVLPHLLDLAHDRVIR